MFDIVAGSRTNVSDLESGYHNVLAMKIINIYIVYDIRELLTQITIFSYAFSSSVLTASISVTVAFAAGL